MKLIKISQQNRILFCSFLFLVFVYFIFGAKKNTPLINKENKIFADTLIPKGLVLVPIDLANIDTIAALIDQFAVVDLFSGSDRTTGNQKIASRVKLLRAPLNPNQYAILVEENLSKRIMSSSGPFWAVVQNREVSTNSNNKELERNTIRIEYHQTGAEQ